MKKFKFGLEAVLKVSQYREEILKKEFGKLCLEKQKTELAFSTLFSERAELESFQKETRLKGTSAASEMLFQAKLDDLAYKMAKKKELINELEKRCEDKRLELVEASKRKKVFEKLEEDQWKQYLVELNREEQSFLDELARYQSELSI